MINSILLNYENLKSALESIHEGSDEYAAKGHGLLKKMGEFKTFYALKLGFLVYSAAEQFFSPSICRPKTQRFKRQSMAAHS